MVDTSSLPSSNIMARNNFMSRKSFLRSWDKFNIPLKFQHFIYRQWALYYAKKEQFAAEYRCLENALAIEENDFQSMYYKYQNSREFADFEAALACAQTAEELNPYSAPACMAVGQCLSDLSRFEDAKRELHVGLQRFKGVKRRPILEQLQYIDGFLNDCLSFSWSPFLMRNTEAVNAVIEKEKRKKDMRPLWKIQRDKGECDVLSEVEVTEKVTSPIARARRLKTIRIATQTYLGSNWKDMVFLKSLSEDKTLNSSSMPTLPQFIKNNYHIASKFIRVLHSRCPVYRRDEENSIPPIITARFKEDYQYRLQYQTARNVRSILRVVRQYREEQQLMKLKHYVYDIVVNYLVLKTHRIFPWKFEFTNQILNELGIAYVDNYLSNQRASKGSTNVLFKLLNLPINKSTYESIENVFGDKKNYDAINTGQSYQETDNSKINALKERLIFSKFKIERAYLLHEIANSNFENSTYDKCVLYAKKAAMAAREAGSNLWIFLCLMLIAKVYTVLQKLDQQLENLELAEYYARKLYNRHLVHFVGSLVENVRIDMINRRSTSKSISSASRISQTSYTSPMVEGSKTTMSFETYTKYS